MAASRNAKQSDEEQTGRRKRYERAEDATAVALTPLKMQVLEFLLDYRFLLVPQFARLMRCSNQAARRNLRELFDAELIEKVATTRALLADDGEANDPSLTYGSAPTIHVLSKKGVQTLVDAGIASREALKRPSADYGPKNSPFLRHEVFLRETRIWLSTLAPGSAALRTWRDGADCEFALAGAPKFRPDASFALDIGQMNGRSAVLAGFVEADRGTERGPQRWTEKMTSYAAIFGDAQKLIEATGYRNARVLVVTRTESRRDWIWEAIEDICEQIGAPGELPERFWIAEKAVLDDAGLGEKRWRVPGVDGLWALRE